MPYLGPTAIHCLQKDTPPPPGRMPPRLMKEKSTFSQQATATLSKGGTQHPAPGSVLSDAQIPKKGHPLTGPIGHSLCRDCAGPAHLQLLDTQ